MYANTLFCMLVTITTASAAVFSSSQPSSNTNHELTADNMILFGINGEVNVVSRAEFEQSTNRAPIATAEQHNAKNPKYATQGKREVDEATPDVEKRCPKHTVWTLNPAETFYDWDIPMSTVIHAPKNDAALVNVDSGYWVGNSLAVSTSASLDSVKKFLFNNFGLSVTSSWTTTYSTSYGFKIPPGKYGAVVSNPLTTRHSGYMDEGCIGSAKRTEFSSDSFQSKSHGGVSWVQGTIGLCIGDTYPLARCYGNGTL
ncbi:hypothetical protein K3495_g16231 [Podosphaera aphanis]|nr:hypothetical protein K3495_g16231 [Podosphaera aphanis]